MMRSVIRMRRTILVFALGILVSFMVSGCETELLISTEASPIDLELSYDVAVDPGYDEEQMNVPEEVMEADIEISDVTLVVEGRIVRGKAKTLQEVSVDIFVGLESGMPGDTLDPAVDQHIGTLTIGAADTSASFSVDVPHGSVVYQALEDGTFWGKAMISDPFEGIVYIDRLYTNIVIVEDTGGLLPFLYSL
jgi:hypothetical protein